ncbi:putative ester cyclase [Streptacidiphilus sp. MAP12-16]|uniref:ester cyclase n=1 Tax=Streptacidiphilus sp. MAP12-16 TaxID=3156300 RepID=UPI0035187F54
MERTTRISDPAPGSRTKESVMNKRQRIALGAALAAVAVGGLTVTGSAANAQTTSTQSAGRTAGAFPARESGEVRANEAVVEAFMRDVLNGHHGDHAARYFTADMQWHGGTVGTVAGRDNVTGLMTTVVTSLPDLHAAQQDIVGQGDEVVVRLVVTGTQTGPLLGIPASGRAVRWDATDLYRLDHGKIAEEWAAEDFTAFLADTGTYRAPWIR